MCMFVCVCACVCMLACVFLGGGGPEGRKCFRVNVDKWVCGVSWGSRELRQLGQRTLRGTGKWVFLPAETPERKKERDEEAERPE